MKNVIGFNFILNLEIQRAVRPSIFSNSKVEIFQKRFFFRLLAFIDSFATVCCLCFGFFDRFLENVSYLFENYPASSEM